jgi:hypothetical protein
MDENLEYNGQTVILRFNSMEDFEDFQMRIGRKIGIHEKEIVFGEEFFDIEDLL